jgi:hypothetical protein
MADDLADSRYAQAAAERAAQAGLIRMAGRHLDPEEGVMREGHIVDGTDLSALRKVLTVVAAHLALPNVEQVTRLQLQPEDKLVVILGGTPVLTHHHAESAGLVIRRALDLDDDQPVLVLPSGSDVSVIEPDNPVVHAASEGPTQ